MTLMINSCVSLFHLASYVPWLYLPQKRRQGFTSPRFFSIFSISMGNFTERMCLSMPFSPNAVLPLGVLLKLLHYDSRKTEKLLRSHRQHPVTPEHTCVFWCRRNLHCQRQCNTFAVFVWDIFSNPEKAWSYQPD